MQVFSASVEGKSSDAWSADKCLQIEITVFVKQTIGCLAGHGFIAFFHMLLPVRNKGHKPAALRAGGAS